MLQPITLEQTRYYLQYFGMKTVQTLKKEHWNFIMTYINENM